MVFFSPPVFLWNVRLVLFRLNGWKLMSEERKELSNHLLYDLFERQSQTPAEPHLQRNTHDQKKKSSHCLLTQGRPYFPFICTFHNQPVHGWTAMTGQSVIFSTILLGRQNILLILKMMETAKTLSSQTRGALRLHQKHLNLSNARLTSDDNVVRKGKRLTNIPPSQTNL